MASFDRVFLKMWKEGEAVSAYELLSMEIIHNILCIKLPKNKLVHLGIWGTDKSVVR